MCLIGAVGRWIPGSLTDEQRVRRPQGYTVRELPVRDLHVSGDWCNVLKAFNGFSGLRWQGGLLWHHPVIISAECCGNYRGTWLIAMKKEKNQSIVLPVAGMEF